MLRRIHFFTHLKVFFLRFSHSLLTPMWGRTLKNAIGGSCWVGRGCSSVVVSPLLVLNLCFLSLLLYSHLTPLCPVLFCHFLDAPLSHYGEHPGSPSCMDLFPAWFLYLSPLQKSEDVEGQYLLPHSLILPLVFSLQTHGEMRKNHRLVSWLWELGSKSLIEEVWFFTDHLPLSGRKLASSTSSMQSSCAWRRHPPNICSGASTCPTRMPESA